MNRTALFGMTDDIDDRVARSLALAIAQRPRATLQQIAKMAGISKATLYRLSPTREGVVALLMQRSRRHMEQALERSDLSNKSFLMALSSLTEEVLAGKEYYCFWNAALWMNLHDPQNDTAHGYAPSFYNEALEQFFLNGQKAGVFRVDTPARWLAKTYDFLLYAAVESEQRGEIAPLGMSRMVERMFLNGAVAQA